MSTRARVQAAAQTLLDHGSQWQDYFAALGTIEQQAAHFNLSRATMVKLRHIAMRAREALADVATGRTTLHQIHKGHEEPQSRLETAMYALCALRDDDEVRGFFHVAFSQRRLSTQTLLHLLYKNLRYDEQQVWFAWAMDAAWGGKGSGFTRQGHTRATDPYPFLKILGVSHPASIDQIKKAYHQKAHCICSHDTGHMWEASSPHLLQNL